MLSAYEYFDCLQNFNEEMIVEFDELLVVGYTEISNRHCCQEFHQTSFPLKYCCHSD